MVTDVISKVIKKDDAIRGLIRMNNDATKGYESAASVCDDDAIASKLRQSAHERSRFSSELQRVALDTSEDPEEGTIFGKLHRGWIDARAKLNSGDATVVVAEVDRAESMLAAAYEQSREAIDDLMLCDLLKAHEARIKKSLSELKALDS